MGAPPQPVGPQTNNRSQTVQAVIFVGLQGAGKSTFYRKRFFPTRRRINLDMLHTRHRERCFLQTCIETRQPFVVENTNPTRAVRQVYIEHAKAAGFRVVGYYFQSRVEECHKCNLERPAGQQIPLSGLHGTANRMEVPRRDEGFDEPYYLRIVENNQFVEGWKEDA